MSTITLGDQEYVKGIGTIADEGPKSKNSLTFKWYKPELVVGGKTLREQLGFAISKCAEIGADVMMSPLSVITALLNHPLTNSGLAKFLSDHKTANA
ncbi:hypothetical protein EXU85_15180 [Spirosoma sp. KCTC 42546]|nr:hypothetical protein EXU85_15180 [Spirosoma sp. KCTC 42546]